MTDEGEPGVNLDNAEATNLALFLVARHLRDDEWLEWENVPELGEFAFDRLLAATEALAQNMTDQSRSLDRTNDIDSAHLFERATTAANGSSAEGAL